MTTDYFTFFTELADGAVVLSLLLLAYQIWLQRQDLRFSATEGLMGDFSRMTLFLVDHPRVARQIYPYSPDAAESGQGSDPQDRQMALYYLDSLLGLFERAWLASKHSKARKEDWYGWRNWLKSLAKSTLFIDLLRASEEQWDGKFREELESILKEVTAEAAK